MNFLIKESFFQWDWHWKRNVKNFIAEEGIKRDEMRNLEISLSPEKKKDGGGSDPQPQLTGMTYTPR